MSSLRARTLLYIAATIGALMVLLFVPLRGLLLKSFRKLEDEAARMNVERARNALREDITRLEQSCLDYASWDETYAYAGGENPTFPEQNFAINTTFDHLWLNLLMIVDTDGKVLFAKAYDLWERREVPLPPSLARPTLAFDFLLRRTEKSGIAGVLSLPEGLWLVAAEPVLTSDFKGPARGTMIMGHALDRRTVEQLARRTRLDLAIYSLTEDLPADVQAVRERLTTSASIHATPLDDRRLAGYGLMEDVQWRPALVLRVELARAIYEEGRRSVWYLALSLLMAGLAFGTVLLLVLERLVLARLARLSEQVVHIGKSGDLSVRLSMKGTDELARTAQEVDHMLASIEELHRALDQERAKSEALLLNILPRSVAERLKKQETNIADSFADVTVLFADLVGFTALSARVSPAVLVEMLNEIFSAFDALAEKHRLEKIKTIGDAYMVVAGLPEAREDHAEAIAEMALDILAEIERFNARRGTAFSIRVGINTGPVVAGVIGKRKFIYDIWGDAVNTAFRMESAGIPGKIQVSVATWERLRDKYRFEARGAIAIKGKGEMAAYLLVGRAEAEARVARA